MQKSAHVARVETPTMKEKRKNMAMNMVGYSESGEQEEEEADPSSQVVKVCMEETIHTYVSLP